MSSTQPREISPDQIEKLPSREIPSLVSAAIELDQHIRACELTMKLIKERFTHEAEADARRAGIKETEGHSWEYHDEAGQTVAVTFPAPSLIKGGIAFIQEKPYRWKGDKLIKMADIKALAGEYWDRLFVQKWNPAPKLFRDLCRALLPKDKAERLIKECEEPSSPRVTFKTKSAPV